MPIDLRDYARTAAQRGWGAGWPSCGGAKAAGTAVVTTARSGVRLSVHRRVARLVLLLLDETERRGYPLRPGVCGGYNCRPISGTSSPSNHSWGLALDLNWDRNPYQQPRTTDFPPWLPPLWNRYGFAWGGDYNAGGRTGKADAMHFEFMGWPSDADEMTALALRELAQSLPQETDDMSFTDDDRKLLKQLRDDIGFARNQTLSALGVIETERAPSRVTPEQAAQVAPARRTDVAYWTDQNVRAIGDLQRQVDALRSQVAQLVQVLTAAPAAQQKGPTS